jgi:hypothetical protein
MDLITEDQKQKLIDNGWASLKAMQGEDSPPDHVPVIKLFCPWGIGTWLITEAIPDQPDSLFGLCDLGTPELGYVSLEELLSVEGPGGLRIEQDRSFTPTMTLSAYADAARAAGRIIA